MKIFDKKLLRQNRNRAAKNLAQFDFLFKEIAMEIIDQIADLEKLNCARILEIGARNGFLGQEIIKNKKEKNIFLVQTDCSFLMVKNNHNCATKLIMDDELLAFKEQSFDLILSNLNLHFINDLPTNLAQIRKILKTNGLFIASFFGGKNLHELRQIFYACEEEIYGGISPRLIPFIDAADAGKLMLKAGFRNSISQSKKINISYSNPLKLLTDLKQMGEANILYSRSKKFISRKFLTRFGELYKQNYSDDEGQVNATFEIVIISGWN